MRGGFATDVRSLPAAQVESGLSPSIALKRLFLTVYLTVLWDSR